MAAALPTYPLPADEAEKPPLVPYVTNAPATVEVPWAVDLTLTGGGRCTGIALTSHWILTSAHCIRGRSVRTDQVAVGYVDGNRSYQNLYPLAPAHFYSHPDFGSSPDRGDDIGLIRLRDTGLIPELRAYLYDDDRHPWDSDIGTPPADVYVAGFGTGSNPGGSLTCGQATSAGTKRLGRLALTGDKDDNGVLGTGGTIAVEASRAYGQDVCGGDSGSPWSFLREGQYLAFAVHSGNGKIFSPGNHEWATLIRPKLKWITDTTRAKGFPIDCPATDLAGTRYRQCHEGRWDISSASRGAAKPWFHTALPLEQAEFGNFDGIAGTDALFYESGHPLALSSSARSPWTLQRGRAREIFDRPLVGDFDGNGREELFISDAGHWYVWEPGAVKWSVLNSSKVPTRSLRLGDFNGDGKADVFRADGASWKVSFGGKSRWQVVNSSSVPVGSLLFGDIDGDGRTDVFWANGTVWQVSYGATTPWQLINSSSLALGRLQLADVDGDGKADVVSADGGHWRVAYGGRGRWQTLRTNRSSDTVVFADFDADGRDDGLFFVEVVP